MPRIYLYTELTYQNNTNVQMLLLINLLIMTAEKTKSQSEPKSMSRHFNRYAYGLFVLVGVITCFFSHDLMMGASMLGIAMIFDPFNPSVKWQDRKQYQRVWLIVHLLIVITLFVTAFVIKP